MARRCNTTKGKLPKGYPKKWDEYVKLAVANYPTLYAAKDLEDCEYHIAHHCFIVLGNGLEWASEPAVLADSVMGWRKDRTDWENFVGKQFFEWGSEDLHREHKWFFEKPEGIVIPEEKWGTKGFPTNDSWTCIIHDHEDWLNKEKWLWCYDSSRRKEKYFAPYPYFEKQFCPAWEIEPEKVAPDWRAAMIKHYKILQDRFMKEEAVDGCRFQPWPEQQVLKAEAFLRETVARLESVKEPEPQGSHPA